MTPDRSLTQRTQIKRHSEVILWIEENDPRQSSIAGFTFGENVGAWEFRDAPSPPNFFAVIATFVDNRSPWAHTYLCSARQALEQAKLRAWT